MAASEDSMVSLFECPVCLDSVLPPIVQCRNGHLVCSSCRANVDTCPVCREQLDDIRNLALEKIAEKVKFPCKFKSSGCTLMLSAADKLMHQGVCLFRFFRCPHPSGQCQWQGCADEVRGHLLSAHPFVSALKDKEIMLHCGSQRRGRHLLLDADAALFRARVPRGRASKADRRRQVVLLRRRPDDRPG
nr:E3 ubiquitin-protein ligase Siah1-like [Rhipicephalus microplus]